MKQLDYDLAHVFKDPEYKYEIGSEHNGIMRRKDTASYPNAKDFVDKALDNLADLPDEGTIVIRKVRITK